jgi:hypothetical protein
VLGLATAIQICVFVSSPVTSTTVNELPKDSPMLSTLAATLNWGGFQSGGFNPGDRSHSLMCEPVSH